MPNIIDELFEFFSKQPEKKKKGKKRKVDVFAEDTESVAGKIKRAREVKQRQLEEVQQR